MEFLLTLDKKITNNMSLKLDWDFSTEEIHLALKKIHPTRAPDPDDMTPFFYQKFWLIVGSIVIEAALHSLNQGQFPKTLIHTYIMFILKKNSHQK